MPEPVSYAPAPAPPKRRSFAGAVVWIAVGVILLLANAHVITWRVLWIWFANYWPVLVILYGIVKLIEYFQARQQQKPFVGIRAGGIVMMILLIAVGLTASGIERFRGQINWNELNGNLDIDDDQFGGLFGNTYNFTQELINNYPGGAALKIVSDRGAVNVVAWDQDQIKVVVNKRVRADDQNQANQVDSATRATVDVAGNEVTINTHISGANKPVQSDLDIYVPRKGAISIETRRGDVSVRDHEGNVKISNSGGDVAIDNITGSAEITMRPNKGSVRANNVSGDVTLDGRVDDTNISGIGGNLRMNGDFFGDMNVSKVAKTVTFTSSRTDLAFAKLNGELSMQSGDLRANQLIGPVNVSTRSKDIHLADVSGDVKVDNENGSIDLQASSKLGHITIENRKGDVDVVLPAKANFQLNAKARRGDINSEFNNINVQGNQGQSTASGSVGGGGPVVEINAEYGDVSIRKTT